MRNLVNWSNYRTTGNPSGEKNDKPSKTVPGMTLSLRELLDRYIKGGSVEVFNGVYDSTAPENIERLDPMERLDLARNLKGAIDDAQKRISRPTPTPTKPEPAPSPVPDSPPVPSPDVK